MTEGLYKVFCRPRVMDERTERRWGQSDFVDRVIDVEGTLWVVYWITDVGGWKNPASFNQAQRSAKEARRLNPGWEYVIRRVG